MDDTDYRNENLTESDTRSKLIDPALRCKGWTEQHIRREVTAGGIDIIDGKAKRRDNSKADYTMRLRVNSETQPVAIALERKNFDLKAVNPNAKVNTDTRTPEDLLTIIEQKNKDVLEALAVLRQLPANKVVEVD